MGFNEKIAALSQRIPKLIDHLETEEATKNALVMPFVDALGYDVFNPQEVVPEFTADVGTKKGEKVDYAIMHNNEVIILIECKKAKIDLNAANMSQLYRYFTTSNARIGVLTNGIQYRFYSDLEAPNKMDTKPFLELDLEDIRETMLNEVRKLGKEKFDLDRMLSTASELKYSSEIQKVLSAQYDDPDEDFVRFFYASINPGGRFIATVKEQYTALVKKAFQQFIRERVSDRLRSALQKEDATPLKDKNNDTESDVLDNNNGITTTEEELEGYQIVKAIVCRQVSPDRVFHRDTKSYMGILLDDNNRKPICRLHFNAFQKYIGIISGKNETRMPLQRLTDIYDFTEQLVETVQSYNKV